MGGRVVMVGPSDLERAQELGARESGLAIAITTRADQSAHATVVNAGVVDHPLSGVAVVAFVTRRSARKLANIRACPLVSVVFRSGWDWITIEGEAELAGPDDPLPGLATAAIARLLQQIYAAAVGGAIDDWAALGDRMDEDGHTAVLVHPSRAMRSTG